MISVSFEKKEGRKMMKNSEKRVVKPLMFKMFMGLIMSALLLATPGFSCLAYPVSRSSGEIEVLAIYADKWGANSFFNRDDYARMGWHVTTAGLSSTVMPCNWFNDSTGIGPITVDVLISEITDVTAYDIIVLMPARSRKIADPYADLINSPETLTLLQNAVNNGVLVWATCSGVRVLAAADIIQGRKVVGKEKFQAEYEAAGAIFLGEDHPPVVDGPVITTVRGMYYHHHNNQAIALAFEQNTAAGIRHVQSARLEPAATDLTWADTIWAKSIGTPSSEGARSICSLPDGGYILTGYTTVTGNPDLLLLKVNESGAPVWTKAFGGTGWEYGNAVCITSDGNFLAVGFTTSNAQNQRDGYLVCTDPDGTLLWEKSIGGTGLDVANSICTLSDGNFALCGTTENDTRGEDDIWVCSLDVNGTVNWSKTFGGDRAEMGMAIQETQDHHLIVCGANGTEGMSVGNMDFYLIKLDLMGNEIWWKTFGNDTGEGYDWAYSAIATSDGGFLMTGASDASPPLEIMMIKVDSEGQKQWEKAMGEAFYDYGTGVCEVKNGYIYCGICKNMAQDDNNMVAIYTDFNGETIWSKNIGDISDNWSSALCRSQDGNLTVAGYTRSTGDWDVVITKIAVDSDNTPAVDIVMPSEQFKPGDPCYINARLWNPELEEVPGLPMFAILDVFGDFYFWPEWTSAVSYRSHDLQPGASEISILPSFPWPANVGTVSGIGVYAALTNLEMTQLYGDYGYETFGWGE